MSGPAGGRWPVGVSRGRMYHVGLSCSARSIMTHASMQSRRLLRVRNMETPCIVSPADRSFDGEGSSGRLTGYCHVFCSCLEQKSSVVLAGASGTQRPVRSACQAYYWTTSRRHGDDIQQRVSNIQYTNSNPLVAPVYLCVLAARVICVKPLTDNGLALL